MRVAGDGLSVEEPPTTRQDPRTTNTAGEWAETPAERMGKLAAR